MFGIHIGKDVAGQDAVIVAGHPIPVSILAIGGTLAAALLVLKLRSNAEAASAPSTAAATPATAATDPESVQAETEEDSTYEGVEDIQGEIQSWLEAQDAEASTDASAPATTAAGETVPVTDAPAPVVATPTAAVEGGIGAASSSAASRPAGSGPTVVVPLEATVARSRSGVA